MQYVLVVGYLSGMKISIAGLLLLLFSPLAFSGEHEIDLKLNDLTLSKYDYSPAVDEREKINFKYQNKVRSYFVYVPKSSNKELPVVVALHGAGRSGSSMIDAWKECSNKYGLMIVAPNGIGNNWDVATDDSSFIEEAIKDAVNKSGVKVTQKYLFGHSNGARKALALAAFYPELYTAIVAHAGTLPELSKTLSKFSATEKPKVGLFLGDSDHIFSIDSARETAAWFEKHGYPTSLYIMKNHSHWYYEDFNRINKSVWTFMSKL